MVTLLEQLSVAVAWPTFVGSSEIPYSTVTLEGQVIVGAMVSSTVILCVPSAKLPQSSINRYTRVTVPGHRPTRPLSVTNENARPAEQASVAVPPAARNEVRSV